MSFRKRLRRIGRVATAGATLGGSETIRKSNRKKAGAFVKKHPELVGAAVGTFVGAPFIGASIGSQVGGAFFSKSSASSFPSPFPMADTPAATPASPSDVTPESGPGFKPGFPMMWLLIGGAAILVLFFLKSEKK